MRNLVPQFLCDVEMAGASSPHCAHTSKQVGHADEIRPPRPDDRGSTTASREWLSVEILTIVLTMTIALVFVLPISGHLLYSGADRKKWRKGSSRAHHRYRIEW